MAEPNVTLREVFELPQEGKPDPQPDRWKEVQERIKKEVKDIKLPAKMHDLGPKICELFNVPLPDILVTSWKKVGTLQAMIEKSKQSPDEVMYIELAQHSINCEQKPHLEMRIKELPVKKLVFIVKLLINLKGFVLKIQNGAIQEMQTGTCEAKGTISFAGQVIVEKKLAPINLPGSINIPAVIGSFQSEPLAKAKVIQGTA